MPSGPQLGAGSAALAPLARALTRRKAKLRSIAVAASLLLHTTLLGAFWYSSRHIAERLPEFRVYRVNIVSPPPQVQGDPAPAVTPPVQAEVAPPVAEPAPQPVEAPPPPQPAPQPQPRAPDPPPAAPPPRQQQPPEQPAPRPPAATPAQGNNPQPVAVGGDGVNVQMEGAEFPFPGYLENVIVQINRHFRWSGASNLEAQVHFYILTDGSVGGMRVVRSSGNVRFDLEATSAVEQAGRRGAFGPLPEGWQQDRLWVSFRFLPPR